MRQILCILMAVMAFGTVSNAFAGSVNRATFTIGIDKREPVISVDSISANSYTSISFFTELADLQGHTITHQWVYRDEVMFEKTFDVKGARWRVWTSKTFVPEWTGTWTVNVLDDDRSVLTSKSFEYQ